MSMLLLSFILLIAYVAIKASDHIGIPSIIPFIALGMIFSYFGFAFGDFDVALEVANYALIAISFYGGFAVRWDHVKSSAKESFLLSTLGVAITAFAVAIFAHFLLKVDFQQALLLGAIVSATDAAGIFSILRSRKLSLKYDTTKIIQLESGANDTMSKSLAFGLIALIGGTSTNLPLEVLTLILVGLGMGFLLSFIFTRVISLLAIRSSSIFSIFLISALYFTYATTDLLGGNGFLSVYILGLFLGNAKFPEKRDQVHFFEGFTLLAQVAFFFILGVYAEPRLLLSNLPIALLIVLFLTFIARPLSVYPILSAFKKPRNQKWFISFAGFRGSTAIILALKSAHLALDFPLLQITFGVVILSFLSQTWGLPRLAHKLNIYDPNESIMRSFSDYDYDTQVSFVKGRLAADSCWVGQKIKDIDMGLRFTFARIERGDEILIPHGDTVLEPGDLIVLAGAKFDSESTILRELHLSQSHRWVDRQVRDLNLDNDTLLVVLLREEEILIPQGDTIMRAGDRVVMSEEM